MGTSRTHSSTARWCSPTWSTASCQKANKGLESLVGLRCASLTSSTAIARQDGVCVSVPACECCVLVLTTISGGNGLSQGMASEVRMAISKFYRSRYGWRLLFAHISLSRCLCLSFHLFLYLSLSFFVSLYSLSLSLSLLLYTDTRTLNLDSCNFNFHPLHF